MGRRGNDPQDIDATAFVRRTFRPRECRESECTDVRYSDVGMEYHLLRDHDPTPESEQTYDR